MLCTFWSQCLWENKNRPSRWQQIANPYWPLTGKLS